ncbi:MAG TPA: 2'-5' RNA ligase family protein [Ilumatobacter sp.]
MARLFVAAWPSPAAGVRLDRLPRPDEPGVRWVPPANRHVTLCFIGEAQLDAAIGALGAARLPRCTVRLGPAVTVLGARQIVVPADGADRLAAAVGAAAAAIAAPRTERFVGHLTIGRTAGGATSAVVGTPFEAEFTVDQVALVVSDLRPDGAVYTTAATFPTS